MEADLAGEGAIGLELGIAVAACVVHLVAALPGEVDTLAAKAAVEPALDGTKDEFAAAVSVEPDVSGPEEVDEFGIPEVHAGDPPLAEQRVYIAAHHGAVPSGLGRRTRL